MTLAKRFQAPTVRGILWCVAAAGLAAASGCSSHTVISGKVTYKNAHLSGGEVSFIAPDGKSRSGPINADGDYEVVDAPLGPTTIVVVSTKVEGGAVNGSPIMGGAGPAPVVTSAVPPKYNDPATSGLSYVVQAGKQTKNIDLGD